MRIHLYRKLPTQALPQALLLSHTLPRRAIRSSLKTLDPHRSMRTTQSQAPWGTASPLMKIHAFLCCCSSPAAAGPSPATCSVTSQPWFPQLRGAGPAQPRGLNAQQRCYKTSVRLAEPATQSVKHRQRTLTHSRFYDHSSRKERGFAPPSSNISFYGL